MATYEIPAEPTVDVLWTIDQETGESLRWERHANGKGWSTSQFGMGWLPWSGLLARGPVTDVDPDDVSWLPPGPWKSFHEEVQYEQGKAALSVFTPRLGQEKAERLAALIARLVNEHVARQAGAS